MHTVKVEFKPSQAEALEQQLLEIASERGEPLNFSLMVLPKKAILTGYFENRAESLEQLKLLGLEDKAHHGYLKARDWQDSVKKHFKPFAYRNVIWAPDWAKDSEIAPLLKKQTTALKKKHKRNTSTLAKVSRDAQHGVAQQGKGAYKKIRDRSRASKNTAEGATDRDKVEVIKLHMGMAFGTGNHPTTRLCLRRCIEVVSSYIKPTVLDIGCGSGVLAITAKAIGAKSAEGFDIDEHSIVVAKRNAKQNKSRAKFYVGDLYKDKLPTADVVFANLLANLITDNAKKLWKCVNPGGTLLLSGLLKEELDKIASLFPADAVHYRLGQWGLLLIEKPE